jgi:hypothetical protein
MRLESALATLANSIVALGMTPGVEGLRFFSRRGGLSAKKNGDADAFGSDERTPSLP